MLALIAGACGWRTDAGRSRVLSVIDSIEWPEGYEHPTIETQDPSNAFGQGRSGTAWARFDHQGESEEELMYMFHDSLIDAGFVVRGDFPHRCRPGRVSVAYRAGSGSPVLMKCRTARTAS